MANDNRITGKSPQIIRTDLESLPEAEKLNTTIQQQPGGEAFARTNQQQGVLSSDREAPSTAGNIQFHGLDIGMLKTATVSATIPLEKGTTQIPLDNAPIKLHVPHEGMSAKIDVRLDKDAEGNQKINKVEISFAKNGEDGSMVTVRNPVAGLKPSMIPEWIPKGMLKQAATGLADAFGDMNILKIESDAEGQLHMRGNVAKAGWLSKWFGIGLSDLDPQTVGSLPKLQTDLGEIQKSGPIAAGPAEEGQPGPNEIKLENVLAALSKLSPEKSFFQVTGQTDPTTLKIQGEGVEVEGHRAPVDVDISGTGRLESSGQVAIHFAPNSSINTGGLDASPGNTRLAYDVMGKNLSGELVVKATTDEGSLRGIVEHSGVKVPFIVESGDNIWAQSKLGSVGDIGKAKFALENGILTWKLRAAVAPEGITLDGTTANMKVKDASIRTEGRSNFSMSADGVAKAEDAAFDVHVVGKDVMAEVEGLKLKLDGGANVLLRSTDTDFDGKDVASVGSLKYSLGISEGSPLLERSLDYDHNKDGLTLSAQDTEFALPINLVGNVEAVRGVARSPKVGELGSAALMNRITEITRGEAKVSENNHVELLIDGGESMPKRMEILDGAEKSIFMQTLIWKDDKSGIEMAKKLAQRAEDGLDVRVIIDALGNTEEVNDLMGDREVYKIMKDAGVKVELYNNIGASALKDIKGILDSHDTLPDLSTMAELNDPAKALGLITQLVRAAQGDVEGVDAGTQQQIKGALDLLMQGVHGEGATFDIGSINPDGIIELAELEKLAGSVAELNHRWHEKYTIVDGDKAVMGGLNVSDEYLLPKGATYGDNKPVWRDTDIFIHGPAVLDLYKSAQDNWKTQTGEDMPPPKATLDSIGTPGNSKMQIVQHRPHVDGDHNITMAMMESIKTLEAGDVAYIPNAYFLTTGALEPMKQVLIDAAQRGVDVRVVTNSENTTDLPQINHAARFAYRDMLAGGVRIFERSGEQTMHTKAFYFGKGDGSASMVGVGSWNMDNRSAALNGEGIALIHNDESLGPRAKEQFLADMAPDVADEIKLDGENGIRRLPPEIEIRNSLTSLTANLL